MYYKSAKKRSFIFRYRSVSGIMSRIRTAHPLTIFSPSGFGKSTVIRYMTYNNNFKFLRINAINTHFVYFDCRSVRTDKINFQDAIFSGSNQLVTKIFKEVIYPEIKKAMIDSLQDDKLTIPVDTELIEFMDTLIKRYPRKRFYIFLDSFDVLYKKEYEVFRWIFKYIRDRYKGQLEYIFCLTYEKNLETRQIKKLGELGNLVATSTYFLPVNKQIFTYFITASIFPRSLFLINQLFNWRLHRLEKYIRLWSGGYGPYVKYLMQFKSHEIDNLYNIEITNDIEINSERLLSSFTPKTNRILVNLANKKPITLKENVQKRIKFLRQCGIIDYDNKIFSPILEKYLKKF